MSRTEAEQETRRLGREATIGSDLCQILAQSKSSVELGADACWLLIVLAHCRQPAEFNNSELQTRCGLSRKSLFAARKTAVDAGWLDYTPAVKAKPGQYETKIPPGHYLLHLARLTSAANHQPTPNH